MSTVDLMLLGALLRKPMNAYEIKKEMERVNINAWVKISSPSIYKNLIKLNTSGYVDGRTVREGEMPEKTIYTINDRGQTYFFKLMKRYSEDPGHVFLDFAAFIANLPLVDQKTGLEMIDALQRSLSLKREHTAQILDQTGNYSFYGSNIVDLYLQVFTTLDRFVADFRGEYIERTNPR